MKLSVKRKPAVAFGIFLLGAMAAMAQTQPTAIAISPANPLIATTQTQQFITLSTTPLVFGEARQIAAGYQHVCALMSDGTVQCWGSNAESQLGNATIATSSTPVVMSGLSGPAIAIAAGGYHTCALISDGTVQCWGFNYYGQLGNGTFDNVFPNSSSAPVTVTGLTGAVAIAAGEEHTCALLSNGTAECWGYNEEGQLGDGTTDTTAPYGSDAPVTVTGLSGAVTISASQFGTCALLSNGTAQCWGDNGVGQSDTPTTVGLSGATSIGVGPIGNCAVTSAGTVQCWGNAPTGFLSTATTIAGLSGAAGVSEGNGFLCAVLSDGTAECLGNNNTGQLGNGTTTNSDTPVTVSGLSGAVAVASGYGSYAFACALLANGTVQCWGYNADGELGNGTTTEADSPVTVIAANGGYGIPSLGAIKLGPGSEAPQTCALLSAGTLQCWGANGSGQLGNGTTASPDTPVVMNGISGVTAIAGGDNFNCALLSNGTAQCLGNNNSGELGNGSTTSSGTLVTVSGLSGVTAIAAGDSHACAVVSGGTVECWGYNLNGQLGNGSTTNSDVPVSVTGLSGHAIAIAGGAWHSCALISGGTVQCWGYNYFGELGNGTRNTSSPYGSDTPVTVTGLSGDAIAIATGNEHTCALISGGTVQCWGQNELGQLGNGSTDPSPPYGSDTPVTVTGLSGVLAITAGELHTCALLSGGTVQCWGYNADGELGNETTTQSDTPVSVTGLTGAVAIAGGQYDVCALLADGAVQCWGLNDYGQLGNGTTNNSDVPVATNALVPSLAWTSNDTSVASIDPATGLATPLTIGSTTITSTYGSLTPSTTTLNVGTPPAFTSANNTTFIAGTAGTFSVAASGPPSPTLSESGTLPSGISFDTSTGVLAGTPAAGTGGSYPIHFGATDGLSPDASQSFTLTIDQAPSVTNATSTTFTVGAAGSFAATATGFPAPTFSESGTLPSGVSFNTSTGVLSGTPAAASGGSYPVVITATNGTNPNGTQNFTLTVDQAPAITSATSATFSPNQAGSFTVTSTGFPAPALSILGELPSGVTFNSSTGVVSGTPAAGSSGTYNLNFIASNGVGANAVQNFALTVGTGAPLAPAITSASSAMFTAGSAGSFTVTATGTPAPTFSASGTLPAGVTFNGATGVLSGTPGAGSAGVYEVTFKATNGTTPNASQNFTLTVTGLTLASGGSTSASVSPGQTANYSLAIIPGGGFAGSVTITCSGAPAGAVCTASPATVNASGNAPIALTVSVATTHTASSPGVFNARRPLPLDAWNFSGNSLGLILLLGIACGAMLPMLKSRRGLLLTATAFVFLALTACGGGGAKVTPPGQYPLTVTANCTGYSSSVQVNLTVQ